MVSVAVDAAGPEAARPFHEAAGARFPTLVDAHNELGSFLGAQLIPNGLLVNGDGEILWSKIGGFTIDRPEDVATVSRWLHDEALPPGQILVADALRAELMSTHLRLGSVLLSHGDKDGAVKEMRRALALEPDNFIVRKQIWMIRFPDKFHPVIDFAWQKQQLAMEKADEAACGPDGCRIPGA